MKFCCNRLQEELKWDHLGILDTDEGFGIYFVYCDERMKIEPVCKLDYCPFCGKRIEIKK